VSIRLEANVRQRTKDDLRGLIIELVAIDESGTDQWSSLEQPDLLKLRSIFSHQNLDLADTVTKVCTTSLAASCVSAVHCTMKASRGFSFMKKQLAIVYSTN
jgi:hypothetical protein